MATHATAFALPVLIMLLCAAPRPTRAQAITPGVEIATCGSCVWHVAGGVLAKRGECQDDCAGGLWLGRNGIMTIADGALDGLPLVTHVDLSGNLLQALPARAFAGLPGLRDLHLGGWNPLVGVDSAAFDGVSTILELLYVHETGLGCVPAGDIPDTAEIYIYGDTGIFAPRCPLACPPGTVYDASVAACVACPAGLHPAASGGSVGGALFTCVPAGWDAALLAVCGSCAFWRASGTGALLRTGSCADDCAGELSLNYRGISAIADGALDGLPWVTFLELHGNNLQALPARAFAGLPRLWALDLFYNPLVAVDPEAFANISTALSHLTLYGTGLGCVPGAIPATVGGGTGAIMGGSFNNGWIEIPRCPPACSPGTVYDASVAACVACPAGLQPAAPGGSVGGALFTCVPAGWDAALLEVCGSCAFWRASGTGALLRTGSCADDCVGDLDLYGSGMEQLRLRYSSVTVVAAGVFEGMLGPPHGLFSLIIWDSMLLGCVPGLAADVQIMSQGSNPDRVAPRCPANCSIGTYLVEPREACATADDGFCDEPVWCEHGTDCVDCADVLGYRGPCDGSVGVCLPCPPGLMTAGIGGAGAANCVEPASLLPLADTACAGAARPFAAAGAPPLCVPELLFPAGNVAHCVLGLTWAQLRPSAVASAVSTGGLGKALVVDEFETWLCSTLSSCGSVGGAVCFTFSEAREVFVPWGYARELNFTKLLR